MRSRPQGQRRGAALLVASGLFLLGSQVPAGAGASSAAPGGAPATPAEQLAADDLRLHRIGTFQQPVFVTGPPGENRRVYVVEKTGAIRVVKRGRTLRRPFLDLRGRVSDGSEQGLLSMAFAPDFARTRRFYVNYTDRRGDTRVVGYRARGNGLHTRRGSARQVLRIRQPYPNHNGGQLQFGPDDRLYIATGDGGLYGDPGNRAQDLGSLHGKILRIDPGRGRGYRVPRSNPFRGVPGARPEVYAYGLRNPWRFAFDRRTGALGLGDVGQGEWEEIDFAVRGAARGANFGWRVFEGPVRYGPGSAPGAVAPVLSMSHANGWCAVIGGVFIRDPRLPTQNGRYLYGDTCRGVIRSVRLSESGARDDRSTRLWVRSLSSFGEDGTGGVYATSLAGPVYRLTDR